MKFDGTKWVNVEIADFSAGRRIYKPCLQSHLMVNPMWLIQMVEYSNKATVMKFDGTNWVNVGTAGFSAGGADYPSLAFSPSGEPYVAYKDDGNY